MEAEELDVHLATLRPGQCLDLRGTTLPAGLLDRILAAMENVVGRARFDRATFSAPARFGDVTFNGDASFDDARFEALASFFGTRFGGNVSFQGVRFGKEISLYGSRVRGHLSMDDAAVASDALFGEACFGSASFRGAEFHGFSSFDQARFHGDATFRGARFSRPVSFLKTAFEGTAGFQSVRFSAKAFLAPALVGRQLALNQARAQGPVELHVTGCPVDLSEARVLGRLTVKAGDADLDLTGLTSRGRSKVMRKGGPIRILSIAGLDADELTIEGADLTRCHLPGAVNAERLRLRDCVFAASPGGRRQLRFSWPPLRRTFFSRLSWVALLCLVAVAAVLWSSTPQQPNRHPRPTITQGGTWAHSSGTHQGSP
ncbi:pentapeptide repeat-containing protein [Herbidospora mongoliensis]|uniref:pentapeptide repeat-containing protein n=1 Tax=Herbidospora mongoliensis TaxID=688067 RepID=UPI00082D359A|nr:pentapeptide repeat-containing protein [Herbidospora mongoliensis]